MTLRTNAVSPPKHGVQPSSNDRRIEMIVRKLFRRVRTREVVNRRRFSGRLVEGIYAAI